MQILKKITGFFITLLVLSITVFFMARLSPGNPLKAYYGEAVERMSTVEKEIATERLGLDKPIYVQYFYWIKDVLKGDWGISFKYKQPVLKLVGDFYMNTLILGGISMALTFILALILGKYCALNENRLADRIICKIGTAIGAIPSFWMAIMLVLIFCVNLRFLPSSGAYAIGHSDDILSRITHLILPCGVLVISHLWYYAYMVRNMICRQATMDYVLVAKSKGLTSKQVIRRHIMPNVMPSYISMIAISVPHILAGTYIVEKIFSYPGLGSLCFEAVTYHDYNMLLLISFLTGIFVMLFGEIGHFISRKTNPQIARNEVFDVET